ncbi:MAG: hypothetical protein PHU71_02695 [Candidatus Gracilibacteria bacterium]|nr:hypothetical protein [Candidatus Gracilibacteria bacterium]
MVSDWIGGLPEHVLGRRRAENIAEETFEKVLRDKGFIDGHSTRDEISSLVAQFRAYVGSKGLEFFGYSPEEILERNVFSFYEEILMEIRPSDIQAALLKIQILGDKETVSGVNIWMHLFEQYVRENHMDVQSRQELDKAVSSFREQILKELGDNKEMAIREFSWEESDGLGSVVLLAYLIQQQRQKMQDVASTEKWE